MGSIGFNKLNTFYKFSVFNIYEVDFYLLYFFNSLSKKSIDIS